jgi:hypothetical protein
MAYLFVTEFGAEMPREVLDLLQSGELVDVSWHHDVAPSFAHRDAPLSDARDLRLWVHAENPMDRESEEIRRFGVLDCASGAVHCDTDDLTRAIDTLRTIATKARTPRACAVCFGTGVNPRSGACSACRGTGNEGGAQ